VLGQIGLPGGGFGLGYGAVNSIGAPRLENIPRPRIPLGRNAVTVHVPVARVTDMLLNPGKTIQYNGKPLTYPGIKLIHLCGGNPFHHNTEIRRVVESWRRPDTIIVHEHFWTPAAKHADIVLPATTTMERNDILAAELDHHWIAMKNKGTSQLAQCPTAQTALVQVERWSGPAPAVTAFRVPLG